MPLPKTRAPRDFREFVAAISAPPWTGKMGARYVGVLGLMFDTLLEGARLAIAARSPTSGLVPPDALDARAEDVGLPRHPGQSNDALLSRLRDVWKIWEGAGSAKTLQEQLATMGITAIVRNRLDAALAQDGSTSWSRVHVQITSHPFGTAPKFGDGTVLGGGATYGSKASSEQITAVRRIVRDFIEAHFVVEPIRFGG